MQNEPPPQTGSNRFLTALIIVGLFAYGIAVLIKTPFVPLDSPQIGKEFPPIEAAGWINSSPLKSEDLRGRVLVVDAWAYWCGPCRMATPALMHLYEKYRDQSVVFLGLTSEGQDEESLRKTREYIAAESVPWPNGFAALKTLEALGADSIPQFWVVDRQNRIVAHLQGFSPSLAVELERAVIQALNASSNGDQK